MPRQDRSPCVFDDDLITADLAGDVFVLALVLEIAVQAREEVYSQVCEEHTSKADNGQDGQTFPVPAADVAGVYHNGVNEPCDQGPCFLRIPAPIGSPGVMRPDRAGDDADG